MIDFKNFPGYGMNLPAYRVRLRDPRVEDAARIYQWRREERIRAHQPLIPLSIEQIRSDLERTSSNKLPDYTRDRFQWIIERLSDQAPMGWITLSIRTWEHLIGEIGYSISSDFHKAGYGTEALRLILHKAFYEAQLYRVEAKCSVQNTASYKLLEKAGFAREGVLRGYFNIRGFRVDHYLYSILRTEFVGDF
ncbi:GNAT family N-acetyltransferase [bacterium]|nr:GNAT family N-acetyltransferase [bacterium]